MIQPHHTQTNYAPFCFADFSYLSLKIFSAISSKVQFTIYMCMCEVKDQGCAPCTCINGLTSNARKIEALSSVKLLSLNTATTSLFSLSDKKLANQDLFGSCGELVPLPSAVAVPSEPSYLLRWNRGDTTKCFMVLDSFRFHGDPGGGPPLPRAGTPTWSVDEPWTTASVPA